MGAREFENMRENISRNITEIKSIVRENAARDYIDHQSFDRGVYLFQSAVRSVINIGNNIIIEFNLRSPMNTADVFISLAENNVIPLAAVRGMKRAALAIPKIKTIADTELLEIMDVSTDALGKCLTAYADFYASQEPGEGA